MTFRFRLFPFLIAFATLGSLLRAAEEDKAGGIRPTVTVASGDTGGTFFGQAPDPEKTRRYYIAAES